MRLVAGRLVAERRLLAAAAGAAMVTSTLVTAFVVYAALLPQAGVREALAGAAPADRSILLTTSAAGDAGQVEELDAQVRSLFEDGLAGAPLDVHAGGVAVGQRLPDTVGGVPLDPGRTSAVVAFVEDVEDHARLLDGAWPAPATAGRPLQAAVPEDVARALRLSVGDRVTITDELLDLERPVEIVGTWRPLDADDPLWLPVSTPVDRGGSGPFLIHRDEFAAGYLRLATLAWVADAPPAALAAAGMPQVAQGVRRVAADLERMREDPAFPFDDTTRLTTGLAELADRLETALVVNRSGLVVPATLVTVTGVYGIVLVARLLTARRGTEHALLRARGASRRQLLVLAVAEALAVMVPALLVAPPTSAWLVRLLDARAGDNGLGVVADLAGTGWAGPPLAWWTSGVVAVICVVALALPVVGRGRTWVAAQGERFRPGRWALAQRAGVDIFLVVLAVLAWAQVRRYGQAVLPRDLGGFGVDPLLAGAPVIAVVATTAVGLRVLPLVTRLGVRLAGHRAGLVAVLGAWQADRRRAAGPVLLLVLTAATAALAPSVAATWQRSQLDQAAYAVGADLRLASGPAGASLVADPAVRASMAAHRADLRLPDGESLPLLALDSAEAADVVAIRPDDTAGDPAALFARLREGRPPLDGLALPPDAVRLEGAVRFRTPDLGSRTLPTAGGGEIELTVPSPTSGVMTVHVGGVDGVVTPVRLGNPEPGRPHEFDVALPPGTSELVGFGASLHLPTGFQIPGGDDAVAAEVRWEWTDLTVVTAHGERVPLSLPDSWQVLLHPGQETGERVPTLSRPPGAPAVSAMVDPSLHPTQTVPFLLAEPVQSPAVPAVMTPAALATTGAELGRTVDLNGVMVTVAAVVPGFPGFEDGSGVVVDLPWYSLHRWRWFEEPSQITEWWLSTAEPQSVVEAAERAGVPVHSRDAEKGRRLADPLGERMLRTLWAAGAGAGVLAGYGLVVDSRARAVSRRRELAVLYTLGASPTGLGASMVVEQGMLAGLAVGAGAAVGVATAATMGTALVITPEGAVPVPVPRLVLPAEELVAVPVGLFLAAVCLGALVAWRTRHKVAAEVLRIGDE